MIAAGRQLLGRRVFSVAQVRAAEAALMAQLPDGALMARAATGLAACCAWLLRERFGRVYGAEVTLLVGSGNNGGDALYAGAQLARRGVHVQALFASRAAATQPMATMGDSGLIGTGIRPLSPIVAATGGKWETEQTPDLMIDGLVGIGGQGPLRASMIPFVHYADRARQAGSLVVAVDIPSGVDADIGLIPGEAITADTTVTFGCLKPGLVVAPGAWRAGDIHFVDIGLSPYLPETPLAVVTNDEIYNVVPPPSASDNKYSRGVVGVVAGSTAYPGAAVLAVGGALAGPAGMTRYVGAAADQVIARWPEVVIDTSIESATRVDAWVVGPGLGRDDTARNILQAVLRTTRPIVVDADALTLLAEFLNSDPDLVRRREAPTVLTPHDGEFARLFGAISTNWHDGPNPGRLATAQAAADKVGATVVLKGDRTIVASPDQPAGIGPTRTFMLATAGTGDVLAGLTGAMLAAGLPAHEAAAAAVYLHANAGKRAGHRGVVSATAVLETLSQTSIT